MGFGFLIIKGVPIHCRNLEKNTQYTKISIKIKMMHNIFYYYSPEYQTKL